MRLTYRQREPRDAKADAGKRGDAVNWSDQFKQFEFSPLPLTSERTARVR